MAIVKSGGTLPPALILRVYSDKPEIVVRGRGMAGFYQGLIFKTPDSRERPTTPHSSCIWEKREGDDTGDSNMRAAALPDRER